MLGDWLGDLGEDWNKSSIIVSQPKETTDLMFKSGSELPAHSL
jgi:hypothetical protein